MRIVLDTNAVLDLLLWHNAELDCVAQALAAGPAQLVCDEACLRELRTVLRYPKFGLDDTQAAALYGAYCTKLELSPLPESPDIGQPRCRDGRDPPAGWWGEGDGGQCRPPHLRQGHGKPDIADRRRRRPRAAHRP